MAVSNLVLEMQESLLFRNYAEKFIIKKLFINYRVNFLFTLQNLFGFLFTPQHLNISNLPLNSSNSFLFTHYIITLILTMVKSLVKIIKDKNILQEVDRSFPAFLIFFSRCFVLSCFIRLSFPAFLIFLSFLFFSPAALFSLASYASVLSFLHTLAHR